MTNFTFLQDSSVNDIEKKYNPILVKHFNDSFHRIEYNIKRNTVYFNILIYFLIYYFYWDLSIKMRRFKVFDLSSSLNQIFSEQKVQPTIRIIQNDSINDLTEKYILNGLKNFEEKTIFLQKNITLGKLATELDTNVKYLSIVIKKHKAENFNSYVNKLRINYITQKLENENNFVKYKISHLSDLCGYSSPAAFTKSFTEIIKTTPSEFIRNIKKKRNEVELETV
ncbi:helix-turn-helix domain-containing protein [Cloacibacterium sp. TD35]|uniref:helix-turn-helix domain-containing protein n=1 Tax=Cloacibacterium sp. TD35 TaxID=2976818 RepID=UPI00237E9683|nr:helix-turn-helix domain-containing protein [Cloacibacterium sp. TD35]WDT67443.1 helix-turn-helix domain-containing protein [Cloacibacterium sp. TD35]